MEGVALSSFLRSRIEFCLLHSVEECAGKPFSVLRPDGTLVAGIFPEMIARELPITRTEAMVELAYGVFPGLRLSIEFDGDVFQMEDQRNWTDATYKAFCKPVELPYPVEIETGARVLQRVRLLLRESQTAMMRYCARKEPIAVTIGTGPAVPMPAIGLGTASHGEPLTIKEVMWLRAAQTLTPPHRSQVMERDWKRELQRGAIETRKLGCGLEAATFMSDSAQEELRTLVEAIEQVRPRICRWLLFHRS